MADCFLTDLRDQKVFLVRRFDEGLGRLNFAARVLVWIKPYLAPMFAWGSAVPGGAALSPPSLVRLVAVFILHVLRQGAHRAPCASPELALGECFRTDAKCEENVVTLAGWWCRESYDTAAAPWFSFTVSADQAPWLFKEGKGSAWASTSAEVLAAVVAVTVFAGRGLFPVARRCLLHVIAGTDNQAGESLAKKGSSTKMPLMMVMMQLAKTSSDHFLRLDLRWRPREENQHADDLTNSKFDNFSTDKRITVSWDEVDTTLLDELIAASIDFQQELRTLKESRKACELRNLNLRSKRRLLNDRTSW